jgi:hypothetical protein
MLLCYIGPSENLKAIMLVIQKKKKPKTRNIELSLLCLLSKNASDLESLPLTHFSSHTWNKQVIWNKANSTAVQWWILFQKYSSGQILYGSRTRIEWWDWKLVELFRFFLLAKLCLRVLLSYNDWFICLNCVYILVTIYQKIYQSNLVSVGVQYIVKWIGWFNEWTNRSMNKVLCNMQSAL